MQYFATTFMNWSELIENLVRDFRLSEPELAQRTGITYPTKKRKSVSTKIEVSSADSKRFALGQKIQGTPELRERLKVFRAGLFARNLELSAGKQKSIKYKE